MKLAIVGPQSPLAQAFLDLLEDYPISQEGQLNFFHKAGFSPLIEYRGREYPVESFDLDRLRDLDPQAVLFFDEEDYREEIQQAEYLNSKVIDTTGAYINEPTIPLIMPKINGQLIHKHNLVSLPSYPAAIFAPLLSSIDKRFTIRRVAIHCQDQAKHKDFFLPNSYCPSETSTLNEVLKILDNDSLHLTVTDLEGLDKEYSNFFINVSMARPFNTEELLNQIKKQAGILSHKDRETIDFNKDLILRRYRRDLSLDSGIHLWVTTKNPYGPLLEALMELLELIKAG